MGNSTKELINAFNLNNYFSDKVNANFTVEGKKIVGLFASNTNTKEYLRRIGEEIIKRHYLGGSEVAHKYYHLNCFPFVLGANLDQEYLGNGIVKVKLADSTNPAVIHNLEIHFANEFKRAVGSKVVARLQKLGVAEEEAYEWVEKTVGTRAIGMPYLYYMAFNDEYFEWERECDEDPSETFEMLKEMYIQEFNSRLEACGLKSSDFYEYKDDMLYIKDVSDKVVKSVAKYVKKEVALDFRTPGSVESKVENCKNVLSELIYQSTGKSIYGYDYDIFTDEKKIRDGSSFALIPFIKENGQLKSLSSRDASKINGVFNKAIPNGFTNSNFISDIRGKTANPQFANCKEPVYAFSNKQIALLLPIIMRSPIAYNQINGRFEFAVDLENFKRRSSSRSSSTVTSPTHAGPSGLRTPPNQRKADSGYDSNSPPRPEDFGAHSPSGDPRSLFEQPQTQRLPTRSQEVALEGPPRRGSEREGGKGGLFQLVPGEEIGLTSISNRQQLLSPLDVLTDFSSVQGACGRFLAPLAKPEDTRGDLESNDECSEAKSQESESPKKHWGGIILNKILSFFKRNNEERNSISSSRSMPTISVTKKSPLSERSASERKAKSNPPSKVTSPTHEGVPEWQQRLDPDQRQELCKVLSPEMRKKLDANFFPPGYEKLLHLLYVDSEELRSLLSSPEAKEQVCSVLPPEEKEQVQSGSPEEIVRLLHKFFSNQKISDNCLLSSKIDSPKIKKLLQEEIFV